MTNVTAIKYEDEMKKSYIDYAMSVIVQRALPDVRDGLKPVHRRILFAMNELQNFPDKPHKKSARIVGDVLGKYHPHGDSSVYDAMVRLSQDFNMLVPLVDGHGNFGSIDGDGAAAMRYTEARLTPVALELLKDLDMNIVDMVPNFDGTLKEPSVLPSHLPNLLVNGTSGIAVGMATSIPSHNLREVVNATLAMLDNPGITSTGLMKHVKGPDFPTGGIISNKDELAEIYNTGTGKVRVRAVFEVENEKGGRKNLVVTEIPYTLSGNKTKVIDDVIKLMGDRKLDEVVTIRDESSKDGLRMVIELKKGANPDAVINKLYKMTKFEDTFPVNLLAISNNRPVTFSLQGLIQEYLLFLKEINHKKLNFQLQKHLKRKEILDGLIKAVDVIDLIIETIRGAKNLSQVKKCFVEGITEGITFKTKKSEKEAGKLGFTDAQATAILTMQLQRLVGLEIEKLNKESDEVKSKIEGLEKILNSEIEFNNYIREDLERIKKEYGKKRLTKIDNLEVAEVVEEVVQEDVYALLDENNYLKIVDNSSYSRMSSVEDFKEVLKTHSQDSLIGFTDDGKMVQIKVQDMKISKSKDRGEPIDMLCDIGNGKLLWFGAMSSMTNKVLFVTKQGIVKLVDVSEYETNRKSIAATKIKDDDRLIHVFHLLESDKELELVTNEDRKLRFSLEEIPEQKKTAVGVTGINLTKDDYVVKAKIEGETEERKRKRASRGLKED